MRFLFSLPEINIIKTSLETPGFENVKNSILDDINGQLAKPLTPSNNYSMEFSLSEISIIRASLEKNSQDSSIAMLIENIRNQTKTQITTADVAAHKSQIEQRMNALKK